MSTSAIALKAGRQNRQFAIAALFLAAFMNLLDITVVNLALPSIQTELKATATELEWVLVIYVLTFAAGLLPFGRFGDIFGRDKVFLWGVAGFVASSLVCGLAPDISTLVGARAIQGLTAAMMVPQVLAIVHVIVLPEEKGKIIGLFGTVSGLGAVAGPLVGGSIVSADIAGLDWRPIFLINIPLGLVSFFAALRFLPEIQPGRSTAADWIGAVLFAAAISCLIYPLTEGRHLGWPAWCIALSVISLPLAAVFIWYQARRAARQQAQLLPIGLLTNRAFLKNLLIVAALPAGMAGTFFMLALMLQSGFGFSPFHAGLATAPHPIGVMIASFLTTRRGDRWIQGRIVTGTGMLLVGMLWLQWTIASATNTMSGAEFLLPLLTVGLGMGTTIVPIFQNALACVPRDDAGAGSGALQAFQQVGIAIGIALSGQIFFHTLEGSEAALSYADAARNALWLPVSLYLFLLVLCLWQAVENRRNQS